MIGFVLFQPNPGSNTLSEVDNYERLSEYLIVISAIVQVQYSEDSTFGRIIN